MTKTTEAVAIATSIITPLVLCFAYFATPETYVIPGGKCPTSTFTIEPANGLPRVCIDLSALPTTPPVDYTKENPWYGLVQYVLFSWMFMAALALCACLCSQHHKETKEEEAEAEAKTVADEAKKMTEAAKKKTNAVPSCV